MTQWDLTSLILSTGSLTAAAWDKKCGQKTNCKYPRSEPRLQQNIDRLLATDLTLVRNRSCNISPPTLDTDHLRFRNWVLKEKFQSKLQRVRSSITDWNFLTENKAGSQLLQSCRAATRLHGIELESETEILLSLLISKLPAWTRTACWPSLSDTLNSGASDCSPSQNAVRRQPFKMHWNQETYHLPTGSSAGRIASRVTDCCLCCNEVQRPTSES